MIKLCNEFKNLKKKLNKDTDEEKILNFHYLFMDNDYGIEKVREDINNIIKKQRNDKKDKDDEKINENEQNTLEDKDTLYID